MDKMLEQNLHRRRHLQDRDVSQHNQNFLHDKMMLESWLESKNDQKIIKLQLYKMQPMKKKSLKPKIGENWLPSFSQKHLRCLGSRLVALAAGERD